jgi:tetratricopeptide (TPR) repeat protein
MKPFHRTPLSIVLLLSLAGAFPARAQNSAAIEAILEKAVAAPKDGAALKERLKELELALAGRTDVAIGEYTRGWILAKLGRKKEAVVAYDRAAALNPKMAEASYNAGCALTELGRTAEAEKRYERTLQANPGFIDAAYNLGQSAYNRKDFAAALGCFQKARTLAPDDFGAAKKVLQAQNALARWEDAEVTREEVHRLRREAKDPSVRALQEYCFDQFDVDKVHVFAYETFEPSGEDAVVYRFAATGPAGRVWGEILVLGSGKAAGKGGATVMQVKVGEKKVGQPVRLKTMPDYPALKERVRSLTRKHILPAAN